MARSRGRDRINRASNPQKVAKRKQETTKEAGLDSAAFLSTPIHAHTKLPTQAHGACVRWARTRRREELCARAPERKRKRDGQGLWRMSLWGTSTLPCTRYEGVVLPTTTARRYTCFLLLVRLAGIKAPTTRETGRPSGDAVTWGGGEDRHGKYGTRKTPRLHQEGGIPFLQWRRFRRGRRGLASRPMVYLVCIRICIRGTVRTRVEMRLLQSFLRTVCGCADERGP